MGLISLRKFPLNTTGKSLRLSISEKNYVRDHYKSQTPEAMALHLKANYSSVIGFMLSENLKHFTATNIISD